MRPWLAGTVAVASCGVAVQVLPVVTARGSVRRLFWPRLAGVGAADRIALTFDDGPDRASTPLFLQVLEREGVRATFFLVGSMLDRDPGLGREIVGAGHEVSVHGWEHRNLLWRSPAATYADIARARDRIAAVTGRPPLWYRPPYGVLTMSALLACRRLELTPRLWTAWGRDWEPTRSPESIWETIAKDLDGGGTVLLHDSDCTSTPGAWRGALAVLPRLITWARDRQLMIGTLGTHQGADTAGPGTVPRRSTARHGMVTGRTGNRAR